MTSKSKYIFASTISVLIVGIGAFVFLLFNTQNDTIEDVSEVEKQITEVNIVKSESVAENPIDLFVEEFTTNDYKVNVKGVMMAFSPLYFEKGTIVRLGDPKKEPNKKYTILKNGSIFFVYTEDKRFKEISDSEGNGKTLFNAFQSASPITQLIKDTRNNTIMWENVGNGYFISQQFRAPLLLGDVQEDLIEIKILTNQTTYLIEEMWVKFDGIDKWEEAAQMTYTLIDDIEEIKKFPLDFERMEIK